MGVAVCIYAELFPIALHFTRREVIGPGGVIIVEETFSSSLCIGRHLLWPFTSGKSKGYSMKTRSEQRKKKSSDDDGP